MFRRVAILSAIALVACPGFTSKPIALTSSDFDLAPLVGVWRGNFSSTQSGRSGTVAFTLRAGESAATGNVVMIPRPDSLLTPEERELVAEIDTPKRQVLRISFIRKEGGRLSGTLDPYTDPECQCIVNTTFEGTFTNATTIAGTYNVVPSKPGSTVFGGSWQVIRVRKL